MLFRTRQFEFCFPRPTLVMGIVNVTPDSFSDGGQFLDPKAAIAHAQEEIGQGADLLDIGGESTRPGAMPVQVDEELRRVIPVIEALAGQVKVPISIDTMKPEVARRALAAGASIVNDVAAIRSEPGMWELVAEAGAGYVCMHAQGTPQTMQWNPSYGDVVAEVSQFFGDRLERLARAGVQPEQVVLDPGIGFGKNLEHNLGLLRGWQTLRKWGRPLLLGASRKSFIAKLLGTSVEQRLPASLACACLAVADGVQIVRTHDVAATVQAVRMVEAILGRNN
jgi:dihydropteroate synthase